MTDAETPPPPPVPPPARPPRRWLPYALAASVALNLAVAGIVAGSMLRHAAPWDAGGGVRVIGFGHWDRAFDDDDRAALRAAAAAERPRLTAAVRDERRDRRALVALLRAEPFDAAAFDAVVARMQLRAADRLAFGQQLIRDRVLAMDAAGRAALAERLERAQRRRPDRDGDRDGNGPGAPRRGD
jgi:uncharacterized membrane protein